MNESGRTNSTTSPLPEVVRRSAKGPVERPRGRAGRPRRRLRRWLFIVSLLASVGAAGWASTVFDPFGTAGQSYRRGQFAAALKAAEAYLLRRPGDRSASLMAARCATRFGQRLRAEEHYRQARPLDRDDLRDQALGLVFLHAPNRAIETYRELLARYPDDAQGLKSLAALYMDRKQFAAAGELGERLLRVGGEEVSGRTLLGIAHHVLKEYEEASEQFERIVQLDPTLATMPLPRALFWDHLAIDLMAQGRVGEARAYLTRASERDEDARLVELLGLAYHREGATADAERCWRKALELDPHNGDALLSLGRLAIAGRPAEAVALLEKAAEVSPGSIEVQHNLGLAYRLVGGAAASERCLKKVSELKSRPLRRGQAPASLDRDRAGPPLDPAPGAGS